MSPARHSASTTTIFAAAKDHRLRATAIVAAPDGTRAVRETVEGHPDAASELAAELAARVLAGGGDAILAAIRKRA